MMHEWACCCDKAANHQLPIAAVFWIIQIVSVEESSNLTQNLMRIRCSTQSVILNAIATQYTCALNGIYHSTPPLTSTVKSSLFMHVHSSPLSLAARLHRCHTNRSCYINNSWTAFWQTLYVLYIYIYEIQISTSIYWYIQREILLAFVQKKVNIAGLTPNLWKTCSQAWKTPSTAFWKRGFQECSHNPAWKSGSLCLNHLYKCGS